MQETFNALAERVQPQILAQARPVTTTETFYCLFLSMSDGARRAVTLNARAATIEACWKGLVEKAEDHLAATPFPVKWLRIDWVDQTTALYWRDLKAQIAASKRNYFRDGIAFDAKFSVALLEMEINANALAYGDAQQNHAVISLAKINQYLKRSGEAGPVSPTEDDVVYRFTTSGVFVEAEMAAIHPLEQAGRNSGRRVIEALDRDELDGLIMRGSLYLASQVDESGRFNYGWYPCFDQPVHGYNSLRHASSLYAMIEAYEVAGDERLKDAIERGLSYLTERLIKRVEHQGVTVAVLVDAQNEVKLGGNAVCLLALVKYSEVHQTDRYHGLLEQLAATICLMQDAETGGFSHVLHYPALTLKAQFRTIYYDGEAAFGLLRLYALTGDQRWLDTVERAFEAFITKEHWKAHDHWLSYAVNELTRYRPERRYYQFGLMNFADHLDFVTHRITTFPTLLELMMAAQQMLERLEADGSFDDLLNALDRSKFYQALETRAHYLLNGHFWPELAMFFANPNRIVGSFFIRHHGFRVRIDDVEHYLSGLIAYRNYCLTRRNSSTPVPFVDAAPLADDYKAQGPLVAWGGDVNLGRRQHYRTAELGLENVLKVPSLQRADLRIVNLECVVTTLGEQGTEKGEGGPYYYRARPEMLAILTRSAVDIVATANNHSGDYGRAAVLDQAAWLQASGIEPVGTGENSEAAFRPLFRQLGAVELAVFNIDATQPRFAAGPDAAGSAYLSLADPALWFETLAPRIAEARLQADVVLVAVHWGDNRVAHPSAQKIAVGHAIIDAGADAVLGASAHVLQGIEIYKDRPILHDAGDLLFDAIGTGPVATGLFSLELSRDGVKTVVFTPLKGDFASTSQLEGVAAINASHDFASRCEALGTRLAVTASGEGVLRLSPAARPQCVRGEGTIKPASRPQGDRIALSREAPLDAVWTPTVVPEDARIAPQLFGPLSLMGVRVWPRRLDRRQMLWVETFWMADRQLDEDIRIDIKAVPVRPGKMRPWGRAMDHDPCDWLVPTRAFRPGQLYRDFYGLRPPYLKDWENGELAVEIGIVSKRHVAPAIRLPIKVALSIAERPQPAQMSQDRRPSRARVYRETFPPEIDACIKGQTWTADQLAAVTGGHWLVAPKPGWFVRSVIRGLSHYPFTDAPTLYVASEFDHLAFHEQYSTARTGKDTHGLIASNQHRLAGAIVTKPVAGLTGDFPLLQVRDPIKALIELGIAARSRFAGDVVAVTGTAGKSTTAAMIRSMLGEHRDVLVSYDNYNSRVGAPALLANLSPHHAAAIVEIAQSALWMQRGPVTRLIRPTIALITEIGWSQTDRRVRSVADVAGFKSRIFDGLSGKAVAILGDHLPCFDSVADKARAHARTLLVFGDGPSATMRILQRDMRAEGSTVTFQTPEALVGRLNVPLPGEGMIRNAMAALSVLYAMGHDVTQLQDGLLDLPPQTGRLQRFSLQLADGAATLIDDSWNAEVHSMLNAIAVLRNSVVERRGRRIAVLGRIVHLGDMSKALHQSLAEPLIKARPDLVVTHGDEMHHLREKLPAQLLGAHFSKAADLAAFLLDEIQADDVILVKGSRRDSDFGSVCDLIRKGSGPLRDTGPLASSLGEVRRLIGADCALPRRWDDVMFDAVAFSVETLRQRSIAAVKSGTGTMGLSEAELQKHRSAIVATIGSAPTAPLSDRPHLHDSNWTRTSKAIATLRRSAFAGRCFAVTGSAGKSSVNSMLRTVLERLHGAKTVLSTTGNQNMFMGVMHSLSALQPTHRYLVQEVAVGHAQRSAPVLRPHIAIVTNISEAHMEGFYSLEGIADAKSAVLRALEPSGVAVICRDTALYERVRGHALRKDISIITYGAHKDAQWRLVEFCSATGAAHYQTPYGALRMALIAGARHQAINAVGCLACLDAAGEDWRRAATLLQDWSPPAGRGVAFYVAAAPSGQAMIVDDAFNAAPIAMVAAAQSLAAAQHARRRVLVLGEMLELGENSHAIHRRLAEAIAELAIDEVHVVGEAYCDFWAALPDHQRGSYHTRREDLQADLHHRMRDGDVWWFKGAHGSGLHRAVAALRARAITEDRHAQ